VLSVTPSGLAVSDQPSAISHQRSAEYGKKNSNFQWLLVPEKYPDPDSNRGRQFRRLRCYPLHHRDSYQPSGIRMLIAEFGKKDSNLHCLVQSQVACR
jgi:hypothetical protein